MTVNRLREGGGFLNPIVHISLQGQNSEEAASLVGEGSKYHLTA
jgi:hypothetical protein